MPSILVATIHNKDSRVTTKSKDKTVKQWLRAFILLKFMYFAEDFFVDERSWK